MRAQVKNWLNAEVIFSTKMKFHTGLSSYYLSCNQMVEWNLFEAANGVILKFPANDL